MSYVSANLYTGQLAGITTSPVQLHPTQACREVMIQSDPANVGNLLVGSFVNQFIVLTPGQAITLPLNSLMRIYVKASTGTVIANWLARD
jgi:hypothetical protein